MEATREIYWNIGASAIIPMYIMAFFSLSYLAKGIYDHLKLLKLGKASLDRDDRFFFRIFYTAKQVLFQTKVRLKKTAGGLHSMFMWGFIVLTIGTGLIFLQADILEPLFGITFLKGTFYKIYSVALDIAGALGILMVLGLAVRRYIAPPKGLPSTAGDLAALSMLFLILGTGYLIEGFRIAVTELKQNPDLASFSPFGVWIAEIFYPYGEATLRELHTNTWWLHMTLVMGFFMMIPHTKLKHLILVPINIFNADHGPKGKLVTIDLEDESKETFGAAKIEDFTWKDILDSQACLSCMRCQDLCPAWNTEKPLSPMKVIQAIQTQALEAPTAPIIDAIGKDAIWSCTTCHACQTTCPAEIEHVPKIIEMRRNLVLMEGEFPGEEVAQAMDQMEVNFNPLGSPFAARGEWAKDLQAKLSAPADADILYFAGCYGSFDARNQKVARNFITLCHAAGVKVAILDKNEKCCGEPARKMGNEYLYQTLATENIEQIKKTGAKKVVTTCPHCYDTLSKSYPDLGLDLEVEHYATYLNSLVQSAKLKINREGLNATYHDSCYLGRYNGEYEGARSILFEAGIATKEMKANCEESFCCGGGGGRIMAEEKLGTRINQKRVHMAADTGAEVLISNCPFCLTMFEDGIKGANLEESLTAQDLSEILIQRLTKEEA